MDNFDNKISIIKEQIDSLTDKIYENLRKENEQLKKQIAFLNKKIYYYEKKYENKIENDIFSVLSNINYNKDVKQN